MKTLALLLFSSLWGQNFQQRGYLETRGLFFPQTVPGDSGRAIGETILRWDVFYKVNDRWKLNGMIDTRSDTHRQVERKARIDWQDRSLARPALSLRRFSASYSSQGLTVEVGKQFIRWGKADILNPTDRFAPKDFLEVVNFDFLGVLAARVSYERGNDTVDLVYTPRMTPSRAPLANQRWVVQPQPGFSVLDFGNWYPGGGQAGIRWNHVGRGYEFSSCFFEGYNHLPALTAQLLNIPNAVAVRRVFPRLRFYGADAAVPLAYFTVKAEAGYFTSSQAQTDEFLLYVVQLERQQGEWSFVGGYAGEYVTAQRNPFFFAPDRGVARTFLGRASYTIDTNRSVALETAQRQSGQGGYLKGEYTQAFGQHWRATVGFVWLRGNPSDFFGQYRRNSHAQLTIRYSF
ncbi:MAG: hypothetical protein NZV14_17795 [Bryobacteraceae bacterium]|nr:hypothetical protein [Bryobacteraceae bacterium]MDW8380017.1 hypothetical protein [Bryobacterales bacterium]